MLKRHCRWSSSGCYGNLQIRNDTPNLQAANQGVQTLEWQLVCDARTLALARAWHGRRHTLERCIDDQPLFVLKSTNLVEADKWRVTVTSVIAD